MPPRHFNPESNGIRLSSTPLRGATVTGRTWEIEKVFDSNYVPLGQPLAAYRLAKDLTPKPCPLQGKS